MTHDEEDIALEDLEDLADEAKNISYNVWDLKRLIAPIIRLSFLLTRSIIGRVRAIEQRLDSQPEK